MSEVVGKNRGILRILPIGIIVLAVLLLVWNMRVQAAETEETVRVGYYPIEGYQEVNEEGEHSGFSYDYYMQIRKYTGWNYEFVEASYADCMKMLMNGEIDIISGITRTPEREKILGISRYSLSNSQNELYASDRNKEIYYEDFEQFEGCTVGVLRGVITTELDQYCQDHGFTIEKVAFDSNAEMEQALDDQKIDLLYSSSVSDSTGTKIVARFDKIPLYYGVAKDKPELLEELNDGLRKIVDNNPDFATLMSEKYMISGENAAATFSKEELEYIRSGEPTYVILNDKWAPISWYDKESGSYKGICMDMLTKIQEYSGLEFIYCNQAEFDKKAAEDPELLGHVVAVLADDNVWAEKQKVMMTNHIADESVVMVSKRSGKQNLDVKDMKIALPKDFYISWCMEKTLDKEQVVYYKDVEACLDAINKGKADATYVNELVATYYLSMLKYSGLFATSNSGYNENLAFAVFENADTPLLGIFDKSILCISSDEKDQIIIQNSIAPQKLTLTGLFYSNPTTFLAVAAVIVLLLGVVFGWVYFMVMKRKQMTYALEEERRTRDARTEFFMMISHELRTPLNAVNGYLALARNSYEEGQDPTAYMKYSQKAVRQLESLSDDMLDYTKISSSKIQLGEDAFDLKEVVRDVQGNIAVSAERKEQDFQFRLDNIGHEYVIGDRLRLIQIMQNILSNAVKFTEKGGKIEARMEESEDEAGRLLLYFTVTDTGRGMSEEFVEKAYAPFEQGDTAYSRTHGGLGLGLFLTRYFLGIMGGNMEVESELGKGSTFRLTIPLKKAHGEQILAQHVEFSYVRALIGAKDPEDGKKLKDFLKRLKIKGDVVESAGQMLKRARSRHGGEYAYKLFVIDESVADEDAALAESLLQTEPEAGLFIISNRQEEHRVRIAGDKEIRFLQKPIFQSQLFDAVVDVFGEYQVEQQKHEQQTDMTGYHILVAEDNTVNADILTRVLKKVNLKVTLCENGKIAVDTFLREPEGTFQLVLMDIQMPEMNGYEATRKIRESGYSNGADIPILAVSANAFPEDVKHSLEAGMNEHLTKPVNAKLLYKKIEKYLNLL